MVSSSSSIYGAITLMCLTKPFYLKVFWSSLLERGALVHIFRPAEIKNTMRSSDLLISRRRYVLRCQFGLVTFSYNQTVFLKLMNVSSALFSARVVVLVLLTVIQDISLLGTGTLVPFTTTSFHIIFQLFNGFFPVYRRIISNNFSGFSTCRNFQHS